MKNSTCIYLVPTNPIYNLKLVPGIDKMTAEYTSHLFSLLYLNLLEVLDNHSYKFEIKPCLDIEDKGFVNGSLGLQPIKREFTFINTSQLRTDLTELLEKHSDRFSKNIIIRTNMIGITLKDLDKISNLLSLDDNVSVIGKGHNGKVNFFGFNKFFDDFFSDLPFRNYSYDTFLQRVCELDNLLYILDGYYPVETVSDFRLLYKVLSKRENYPFCSREIHEKLTDIFIEYKELL
ncbi:MAG TPA: hypothetical protein PK397_09010 [Ignavibacteriaceae bacterium]|nr:hypothetical protein [Ignavibacteriaceae bacterium]